MLRPVDGVGSRGSAVRRDSDELVAECWRTAVTRHAELTLDDMMNELRARKWTLFTWGPQNAPYLVAGQYRWADVIDIVLLRPNGLGCAYRCPARVPDPFRPDAVVFQFESTWLWALRMILIMDQPGHPDAPTCLQNPSSACLVPVDIPGPLRVQPLSRVSSMPGA